MAKEHIHPVARIIAARVADGSISEHVAGELCEALCALERVHADHRQRMWAALGELQRRAAPFFQERELLYEALLKAAARPMNPANAASSN